jgi:hypothetical protein
VDTARPPRGPEGLVLLLLPTAGRAVPAQHLVAGRGRVGAGGSRFGGLDPARPGGPVAGLVQFPIQGPDTEYTLDFTFDRQGVDPPEFVMTLEAGIDWMLFNSVTPRTAPLVALPGPVWGHSEPWRASIESRTHPCPCRPGVRTVAM